MSIKLRPYNNPADYDLIGNFLIEHYKLANADGNWIQPAWEYMHGHPYLDKASLEKIGLWEDDRKVVAVAHYESRLGEAFFQFHPDYRHLRCDMLDYAEEQLYGTSEDGKFFLHVYVNDMDDDFISLAKGRGYEKDNDETRTMLQFVIPTSFPAINLPEGFQLKSLADDCDWVKVNRVLWRGFNHEGEPPVSEYDLDSRRKMFDTSSARRDLKIVVEAPNGNFASFCGMFYEPTHQYAYV
jgi:hypothetical protein